MKTRIVLLIALAASTTACGPSLYVRNRDKAAGQADSLACHQEADTRGSSFVAGDGVVNPADAVIAYRKCLADKGWVSIR